MTMQDDNGRVSPNVALTDRPAKAESTPEDEIAAMKKISDVLAPLDAAARVRVADWTGSRHGSGR
jgi:hypothetical protein